VFQEIETHFKSVSRDSKTFQVFQEFQEHVSRVTNESRLNFVYRTFTVPCGPQMVIVRTVAGSLATSYLLLATSS